MKREHLIAMVGWVCFAKGRNRRSAEAVLKIRVKKQQIARSGRRSSSLLTNINIRVNQFRPGKSKRERRRCSRCRAQKLEKQIINRTKWHGRIAYRSGKLERNNLNQESKLMFLSCLFDQGVRKLKATKTESRGQLPRTGRTTYNPKKQCGRRSISMSKTKRKVYC